MKLKDKVALITGGGSGIGKATALTLSREGAKVVLFGRRCEPLETTAKEVRDMGGEASPITGSVASDKEVMNAVDKTVEIYGKIDILINNAGVGRVGPLLHETTNEDWKLIMGTNLEGAYRVTRAVIPHFLHNNGGVIVNVSSTAGMIGLPGASLYCISKAGMIHFTKAVALEYAKQGIRSNCVCPAAIETDFLGPLVNDEKTKEWLYSIHPIGRIGQPEEVAKAILYLVSDDTAFVTGSVFTMDGGQTLQ